MRILVTGFDPFGGDTVNPSAVLAESLAGDLEGARVVHAILPCAFAPLQQALRGLLAAHQPDIVVGFGLATGRSAISLERVAINIVDARIADNLGAAPIDAPVLPDGPAAYFTTLPIKAAQAALEASAIEAAVSQTAGTFVCNAAFYLTMHLAATEGRAVRAGFVHVPCLTGMPAARDGAPSLDRATLHSAGRSILKTCLECHTDLRIAGGAVS